MSVDAYYAAGKVAVLSLKLWNEAAFLRLAECDNIPSAMRTLAENGYGGGESKKDDTDFEAVLKEALAQDVAFLNDMSPNRKATDCFLLVYDYTNVKNMMKCKYCRTEPQNLFECALIDPQTAWQNIAVDDYRMFSEEMQQALNEIDRRFVEGDRKPSVIDKLLDKAYFEEIARRNRFVTLQNVKNYWKLNADIANVSMLIRSKRAEIAPKSDDFAVGGNIKVSQLSKLCQASFDEIRQALSQTEIHDFVDEACRAAECGESLAAAAHIGENLKRQALSAGKDSFSAEPVICYFLSKTTEIDNIRTVMICIKNNIDKGYLKQTLKELYI